MPIALIVRRLRHWVFTNKTFANDSFFAKFAKLLVCETFPLYGTYTLEPLYYQHFGTLILVLNTEVSSIQRSLDTLQYYTGTQKGVLIIEISTYQKFVIERFHCMSVY